jgi:Uma2 family endonuclease
MTEIRLTEEEYFALEQQSELRHEFVNTVMLEKPSVKKQHNRIIGKLLRLLDARAEAKNCDVFFTVVKMQIPNGKYRYPDVVVTCEEDADEYLIKAPCVVFEVLSDSTRDVDEHEKLEEYLKIASVQRYVLLRQDRALAMVYSRDGSEWRFLLLENTGGFDIPCLGLTLRLEDIYAGIVPVRI